MVGVISTLTKRGVMPFVWAVDRYSRTTSSSPKFNFKRTVSVDLVPLDNSFPQRVGTYFANGRECCESFSDTFPNHLTMWLVPYKLGPT